MQLFEHLPLGWTAVPLGELGELNRGRSRHRPRHDPILYGGAFPFIQTGDVAAANGRITRHHQNYSEEGLKQSRLWPVGTLCITIAANIAETAFLSYPACFPDSIIGFIANPTRCNRKYVYYALQLLKGQIQSLAASSGSVQDNINLEFLQNLLIPLPPLEKQNRIASTLGIFDDKIFSNLQIAHTLEEMSQALFKSWFVDFDPVVLKSEGRKPFGMSDDIAALFPDSFEESELGAVPKGWRVVETGHITDIQNGFAFKSDWWKPQGTPVVKIGSVKSGYVDVADASYLDSSKAAEFQAYELEEGDILIGLTGYPGEVGLVPRSIPKPLLNQRVGKFTPKRGIYRSFVYTMTRQSEFREQVEQRAHGTAQLNVSTGGILSIKCVIPSEELFEVFDELVRPMITKILNCFAESSQLSKARDMLLPELLGGGINETAHVTEPTAA